MEHQIAYRQARNSMLDSIGLGTSLPVRDLQVAAIKEKVAFNKLGKLAVLNCEKGIRYQPFLVTWEGESLVYTEFGNSINCKVHDEDIILTTNPIKYDSWFAVRATKPSNRLDIFLHEFIPIQVGIDTSLAFGFKGASIIDYQTSTTIVIEKAQEGVLYELLDENDKVVSAEAQNGLDADLELTTILLLENTLIKVRATKIIYKYELDNSESSTGTEAEIDRTEVEFLQITIDGQEILNQQMALVRPNLAIEVSVSDQIIEHNTTTKLLLQHAQKSVEYTFYARNLNYSDYYLSQKSPSKTDVAYTSIISTSKNDRYPFVSIFKEQSFDTTSFKTSGQATTGSDGTIELLLPTFTEDQYLVVFAKKKEINESIQLQQHSALIVRPDTTLEVAAEVNPVNYLTETNILVTNTQNDVGYQLLRLREKTELIGEQAYHSANRSVDFMRVGFDFLINEENTAYLIPTQYPQLYKAILPTGIITENDTYAVRAEKRRSGLTAQIQQQVELKYRILIDAEIPVISLTESDIIPYNTAPEIEIKNTQEQVVYQLYSNTDISLSEEVFGTGTTIRLKSKALLEDDSIKVKARKVIDLANDDSDWLWLTGTVSYFVQLNPNLIPIATTSIISYGSELSVIIDNTQTSVEYEIESHYISDESYTTTSAKNSLEVQTTNVGENEIVYLNQPEINHTNFAPASVQMTGTGKQLQLTSFSFTEDVFLVVKATKESTEQAYYYPVVLPVLVKPDHSVIAVAELENILTDQETFVIIDHGEAGVKYQLQQSDTFIGEAAYHPDDRSLERMRSGIDYSVEVIEKNYIDLPTGNLNVSTNFTVRATKLTSGIYTQLNSNIEIVVSEPAPVVEITEETVVATPEEVPNEEITTPSEPITDTTTTDTVNEDVNNATTDNTNQDPVN